MIAARGVAGEGAQEMMEQVARGVILLCRMLRGLPIPGKGFVIRRSWMGGGLCRVDRGLVSVRHAGSYGLQGPQASVETGRSHWNQIGDLRAGKVRMPDLDDLLGRAMAWAEPQYLAERKARVAALAEGAELEDADLWPLMLLIDDERRQVPNIVRDRVHAQRSHYIKGFSLAEIEASVLVPEWQKRQFRTFGFTLIALPMPALVTLPRGRRQLEAVEARLFEALRVWGFALRPALRLLVERAPSLARASASEVDYLAAHAPDLVAIAEPPRVYRRVSGSMIRLLLRRRSSLCRIPPLLRSV